MICDKFNRWCDDAGLTGVAHVCEQAGVTYNYIKRLYRGALNDVGVLKLHRIVNAVNSYSATSIKLEINDFLNEELEND